MSQPTQPTPTDFSIINPKNDLMVNKQKYEIKQSVLQELQKLPYDLNLKYSNEFVKYVMRLIDFVVPKSFKEADKKDLVLDVISTFIPLTETEKQFILDTINFLIQNKLIQPVKLRKYIVKSVSKFFRSKLG